MYICEIKRFKITVMATIAFQYDAQNSVMQHLIDTFVAAGAKITMQAQSNADTSPYNQSFVTMIKDAEKAPKRKLTPTLKAKYFGDL
jgi:hypothetical protein